MEDVLKEYPGEVCRFYFLSAHFRKQTEYSRERLEEAKRSHERLYLACVSIDENLQKLGDSPGISSPAGNALREAVDKAQANFFAAMDDDFNSAGALGSVFDLVKTYYKLIDENGATVTRDKEGLEAVKQAIIIFDQVLGIFPRGFPRYAAEIPDEVSTLVSARQEARKARDFRKADEIRARLDEMGYIVEDTAEGVRVRRK
jgi:cysteinyl-tRNA synthetase